jgi:pantothenate kinase
LYDQPPWPGVRELLDECWWIELDDSKRRNRLVDRHVQFGKTRAAAERWVNGSDEANARAVASGAGRADVVVRGDLPELG